MKGSAIRLCRWALLWILCFGGIFAHSAEPPKISAKAYVLLDISARQVLAQQAEGAGVVVADLDWQRLQGVRVQLPALQHRVF